MRFIGIITCVLVLGLSQTAAAASDSADTQKKEASKSMTVEDIGHGLKSAAQNIEKEIPKIGPAIKDSVKNLNKGESKKQKAEGQSKEKK